MNYNNDKLDEIYRDTWPNLGWATRDKIKTDSATKFTVYNDDSTKIMNDTYWGMSKWEWFLDGFNSFSYALNCYNDGDKYGYQDFWEALSWGWMCEYIYPYDDCYNPTISKERKLRLGKYD